MIRSVRDDHSEKNFFGLLADIIKDGAGHFGFYLKNRNSQNATNINALPKLKEK